MSDDLLDDVGIFDTGDDSHYPADLSMSVPTESPGTIWNSRRLARRAEGREGGGQDARSNTRFRRCAQVIVGVAYEADVDKAHELMIEAAKENEYVIEDPGPVVSFEGFGDNSLTLLLRAYIDTLDHRLVTVTMLHKAINKKFKQAGISIAFPQRDLHLNTLSPLQVEVVGAGQAPSGEVK